MNERELFDAIGRLPEQYRTEAFSPVQTDQNEIDAMFESSVRTEAVCSAAEPQRGTAAQKPAAAIRQTEQPKPHRSGLIGLTAIAAAVALTVGIFAWSMRQETLDPAANPGNSADLVQQSDISGEPVTALPENNTDSGISTTTAADSSIVSAEDERYSTAEPLPESLSDSEVNILGGHGPLRIVESINYNLVLEDQDFWYYNANNKVSKSETNQYGVHEEKKLCDDPGCEHQRADNCLRYRYECRLMSDGQSLFLAADNQSEDPTQLDRINSSGETQPFFSLKAYPALRRALEQQCKTQYPDAESVDLFSPKLEWRFMNFFRLGDEDLYYMVIGITLSEAEQHYFNAGFLLNTKDGSFAMLPLTLNEVRYDPDNRILCLSDLMPEQIVKGVPAQQIMLYDIKQIRFTKETHTEQEAAKIIYMADRWCLEDGRLIFIRVNGAESDAPGAAVRYSLESCNLNRKYQLKDIEAEVLEENTDKLYLTSADGRLYYVVKETIGPDRICSCDPDGQNEVTVFESEEARKIGYLYPMQNSAFLRFTTSNGRIVILENGESYRIKLLTEP